MVKGILAFCILLFFIFGYYFMGKLNNFSTLPDTFPDPIGKAFILVFGCTKLADKLISLLEKRGFDYIQIEDENQLNKTEDYSHLFAISENDLENLMITMIANKTLGVYKNVAICNNLDNTKIFEQNNLRYLYGKSITEDALFNAMFLTTEKPKEQNDD